MASIEYECKSVVLSSQELTSLQYDDLIKMDEIVKQSQEIQKHMQWLQEIPKTNQKESLIQLFLTCQSLQDMMGKFKKQLVSKTEHILPFVQEHFLQFSKMHPCSTEQGQYYMEERSKKRPINDDVLSQMDLSPVHFQTLLNHPDRKKKKSDVTLTLLNQVLGKTEAKQKWNSPLLMRKSKYFVFKPTLGLDFTDQKHFAPPIPKLEAIPLPVVKKEEKTTIADGVLPVIKTEQKVDMTDKTPTIIKKEDIKKKSSTEGNGMRVMMDLDRMCQEITDVNEQFFKNPLQGIVPAAMSSHTKRKLKRGASDSESDMTTSSSDHGERSSKRKKSGNSSDSDSDSDSDHKKKKKKSKSKKKKERQERQDKKKKKKHKQ